MEICDNQVWDDVERWKKLIDTTLDGKVREVRESVERQKEKALARLVAAKRASGTTGFTTTQDNYEEDYIRVLSSSVAVTLQQFTDHMANYRTKLESSKKLITKYGKRYKVDKEKLFAMGVELQVPQKVPKPRTKLKAKLLKRHNSLYTKCSKNSTFAALVLAIPYMAKGELLGLLLLNRNGYGCLKEFVFRHVLLESDYKIALPDRCKIWSQIISIVSFLYLSIRTPTNTIMRRRGGG